MEPGPKARTIQPAPARLFGARPGRPAHERLQLVPALAVHGTGGELRRRRRWLPGWRRRLPRRRATVIKSQVTRHKSQGTRNKSQGTSHKAQGAAPNSQSPPNRQLGVGGWKLGVVGETHLWPTRKDPTSW